MVTPSSNHDDHSGLTPPRERPYFVRLLLPRCPCCRSADLKTVRTTRRGGTVTRHARCRTCGQRLFVLVQ